MTNQYQFPTSSLLAISSNVHLPWTCWSQKLFRCPRGPRGNHSTVEDRSLTFRFNACGVKPLSQPCHSSWNGCNTQQFRLQGFCIQGCRRGRVRRTDTSSFFVPLLTSCCCLLIVAGDSDLCSNNNLLPPRANHCRGILILGKKYFEGTVAGNLYIYMHIIHKWNVT